jgi:hypothetical protein
LLLLPLLLLLLLCLCLLLLCLLLLLLPLLLLLGAAGKLGVELHSSKQHKAERQGRESPATSQQWRPLYHVSSHNTLATCLQYHLSSLSKIQPTTSSIVTCPQPPLKPQSTHLQACPGHLRGNQVL